MGGDGGVKREGERDFVGFKGISHVSERYCSD